MKQLIPVSLSHNKIPFDAIEGIHSSESYNPLPEYNDVTVVYSTRKTNIDVLGATKNCFDKSLTIFYINVQ